MEHRLTRRMRIHLEVALYSRGSAFARGVTRDIGVYGTYVRTDPGLLRRNALVEVEILALGMRLPALVVHCDDDGVGLAFDDTVSPDLWRQLQAYLQR